MSETIDNGEPSAIPVSANPYNTYGLATQGFVLDAIEAAARKVFGRVRSVNGESPDLSGNVDVSFIRTVDYSGDVNQINSDLTVLQSGVPHRLLTDSDYESISGTFDSKIDTLSGYCSDNFTNISEASGGWNSTRTTVMESSGGWQNHVTFRMVPYEENEPLSHYTSAISNPSVGDSLILRKQIVEGSAHFSYSSFEFDGNAWVPAAGTYNVEGGSYGSEDVFFTENLTTTYDVGSIEVGESGSETIRSKGRNIKQLFEEIFMKEMFPSTILPSASLSSVGMGVVESGSTVTPSYSISYNNGKYTYGPESTASATAYSTEFNGHTYTSRTGSTESVMVTDSMSSTGLRMESTVSYGSDSAVPVTNLGRQYPSARIVSGNTETVYSPYLRSYRPSFCGCLSSKSGTLDSSLVRGLSEKSTEQSEKGSILEADYAVGDIRTVFAYPSFIGDAVAIVDRNGLGANIIDAFTKSIVDVNDASGSNPIPYNVYLRDVAEPNDTPNVYRMII